MPDDNHSSAACIEFLKYLHGVKAWPKKKAGLANILIQVEKQATKYPSFCAWLVHERLYVATGGSNSKRREKVIAKLLLQSSKLNCVSGIDKDKCEWAKKQVKKIVNKYPQDQLAQWVANNVTTKVSHGAISTPSLQEDEKARSAPRRGITQETPEYWSLIDTQEKMLKAERALYAGKDSEVVAIDCEGVPENLFLIQVATPTETFIFDCVKLRPSLVCKMLEPLLKDSKVVKLFHDLHNDAAALGTIGGVSPLRGTFDTQLMLEFFTGDIYTGFNGMLRHLEFDEHPLKQNMKNKFRNDVGGEVFSQRPLPRDVVEYAALDVKLLIQAETKISEVLGTNFTALLQASDMRAAAAFETQGMRRISFDLANGCAMASPELLQVTRPSDMLAPKPLHVSDDTQVLLKLLPEDLPGALLNSTEHIADINLDKGRRPHAWVKGERVFLGDENRLTSSEDIETIVEKLGGFGHDNRAGLEQQLHRVSAIRNRDSNVIGLTMRVGRHVSGNATMISDLLFAANEQQTNSILFLGEPGSGKTTIVREVSRLLSERFNVCIVDTSNEIAGDGDVPHPCVGHSRRMMVRSLNQQGDVMIECVQNHTPDVMVIDEIGRSAEVEAARTCKQRGVRLIASAHGDLRKLVKNPKLRGLVGGVETVTLGDAEARKEGNKGGGGLQKLKSQRAGAPVFDILVELRRGSLHEWSIVLDSGEAVDSILEGSKYKTQQRTRDPLTGGIQIELGYA